MRRYVYGREDKGNVFFTLTMIIFSLLLFLRPYLDTVLINQDLATVESAKAVASYFLFIVSLLLSGISTALLFSMWKKATEVGRNIYLSFRSQKHFLCEGVAVYDKIRGWIFLTDSALEYYPEYYLHPSNAHILAFEKIKFWYATKNELHIQCTDNTFRIYTTPYAKQWAEQMDAAINQYRPHESQTTGSTGGLTNP